MPADHTAKASVDRQWLEARLAKTRAETAAIQRAAERDRQALTASTRGSAQAGVRRVRQNLGPAFDHQFPAVEVHGPEAGPGTVLVRREARPLGPASPLKQRATAAGFSRQTWLWQSTVRRFDQRRPRN